ncbi:MAG: peptide chain release factor N(5)-glutamine methyltransferase [Rickettsiales bacterium]|nr:peptide chain release factor N(5)-glutamine methyltransferase [Rickettsiales bacterium]
MLGLATTLKKPQPTAASAKEVLRHAVLRLQQAYIETASMDARILLQHVVGVSREELLGNETLTLSDEDLGAYEALVQKRIARMPIAHLTGRREFWGLTFRVTPHTLDPRPDSETLIEAALARFTDREAPLSVLDLGTGSGCLLLSVLTEYPHSTGSGVDACEHALAVAGTNAAALGLDTRATFLHSCWAEAVKGTFDLILANPPYIPTHMIETLSPEVAKWEPKSALDGGPDGLDCYRAIMPQLPALLAPNGLALFEIGMGQAPGLEALAEASGLAVIGTKDDLALITRCVMVAKK